MKGRVLVLNMDYQPISVCTVKRAFLLVFLKKAQMLNEVAGMYLRTVTDSFPMPSVIQLNRFVTVPYKSVELSRQNIFKRDGFECQYCQTTEQLTLDHIVPRSKGGRSSWKNLVTACKTCNARKGDYTPEEAEMKLLTKPFKPSYIMFIRDFSGFVHDEWKPYLRLNGHVKTSW